VPRSGNTSASEGWVSLGGPDYGEAEIEALRQVVEERRRFRMGRRTRAFEARVAALLGKRHGVMVNSGSSAIELGVQLLGLEAGDEVITPPLTFSTTVAPLVRAGLVPAFVDAAPGSFVIDVERIEEMVGERTRAILAPNLIGNVPDWDHIREIADRHQLVLFEDSCDTLGASLRGRPPGARADVSATSFNESHLITCLGTGGLVAFDDPEQDAEARLARNWGRSSSRHGSGPLDYPGELFSAELDGVPYHRDFVFERLGFNLEGSEPMAAFGLAQLDRLAEFAALHRAHFAAHARYFAAHEACFELPRQLPELETAWMSYPIVVRDDAPFDRRRLHQHLEHNRIGTRPVWSGNLLRHPGFRNIPHRAAPAGYPVADAVLRGGLLIPAHHGLDREHIARVHQVLDDFLAAL
jgi:CDP-6-deoxy-D-xylo-4-hexulose-3-dehydrase